MNNINVQGIIKKHENLINEVSTILAFSETKKIALKKMCEKNIKVDQLECDLTTNFFGWCINLEKEIDLIIYFNKSLNILEIGIEGINVQGMYEVFDNIKKSDKFFKGVF